MASERSIKNKETASREESGDWNSTTKNIGERVEDKMQPKTRTRRILRTTTSVSPTERGTTVASGKNNHKRNHHHHNTKKIQHASQAMQDRETNEQGRRKALAKVCKDTDGVRRGTFTQDTRGRKPANLVQALTANMLAHHLCVVC